MMRVLLFLTILLGSASAFAESAPSVSPSASPQGLCLASFGALEALSESNILKLAGVREHVRTYETHADSKFREGGDYIEKQTDFRGDKIRTAKGTMRCVGGELLVVATEGDMVESYEPPLPWLKFPLEVGATWSWKGKMTLNKDVLDALAEGSVVGIEEVSHEGYSVKAIHVVMKIDFDLPPHEIEVHSWILVDPVYWIVKRTFASKGNAIPPLTFWTEALPPTLSSTPKTTP